MNPGTTYRQEIVGISADAIAWVSRNPQGNSYAAATYLRSSIPEAKKVLNDTTWEVVTISDNGANATMWFRRYVEGQYAI